MAADCTYVTNYGSQDAALKQIVSNWNQASKIFESTFNVALGIVKVDLQSTCSAENDRAWNRPCSESYEINRRLSDFSRWRGTQDKDAGLWHLMTKCNTGSTGTPSYSVLF